MYFLRHNPAESISGKQLGDAAHRLVVNSLQMSRDNHHSTSRPAPFPYNTSAVSAQYSNSRYDADPRTAAREEHRTGHSQSYGYRNDGPGHWHASSTSSHYYDRPPPSHYERDHYNRSHYPYNGSSHVDARSNVPVYYPQSQGYPYPSVNDISALPPVTHVGYSHSQSLYDANYRGYYDDGGQQRDRHYGADRAPAATQYPGGRSYGQHQQANNRYAALDRGSNWRSAPPPPPGYGG